MGGAEGINRRNEMVFTYAGWVLEDKGVSESLRISETSVQEKDGNSPKGKTEGRRAREKPAEPQLPDLWGPWWGRGQGLEEAVTLRVQGRELRASHRSRSVL